MDDPSSLPTVAVVIPTHGGRAALLERSLSTLLADPATTELIVVLDVAEIGTESVVRNYDADQRLILHRVTHAAKDANRGQASRDAGAQVAKSEVILTLDDDVEPDPGLVTGHARHHASERDLVVLGYMPVWPPQDSLPEIQTTARLYAEAYERVCNLVEADSAQVLMRFWGGHFSLRREHWLHLDPPRASATYHVDLEFALRLRNAGLNGRFDRSLRGWHRYRRTLDDLLEDARSSGVGRVRLHEMHPTAAEPPLSETGRTQASDRLLLWLSRRPALWRICARALIAVTRAASCVGMRAAAYLGVRVVWRLGTTRGLRDAGFADGAR